MIPGSANPLLLASAEAGAYEIERSVRFNSSDSGYLSRTPASAGNRKTWTWAGWVKRGKVGSGYYHLFLGGSNPNRWGIGFVDDYLTIGGTVGDTAYNHNTTAVFRDPSAWYHIVAAVDTTQATNTNRIKLYVNGVQQTAFSSTGYPNQNADLAVNNTVGHLIGNDNAAGGRYFNGYLADCFLIDGQALDPTSFGEFDTNGIWQPIEYTGTYGTNGFHLDFSDNSTAAALGTDTSGNSNDWTVNNISVAAGAGNDSLVDVPTNGTETDTGVGGEVRGNYCTWNAIDKSLNVTLSNGNLDTLHGGAGHTKAVGNVYVSSGKWYAEFTLATQGGNVPVVGINSVTLSNRDTYVGSETGSFGYSVSALKYSGAAPTGTSYGATFTAGDVIGVALDLDAGTLVFYKNGASQGTAFTGISGTYTFAASGIGSSASWIANWGQRPFAYTAPSGFKALCTANLPAPVVTKPSEYMDVALYTGNGSTQTISGLEFSPDLVWIKSRSNTLFHFLIDTVRGNNLELYSNATNAESSSTTTLTAFNSDGFDLGNRLGTNENTGSYVAWTWDAGSSTVTNTDGSITSQVRANPSAGFSIVTYTSQSSGSATIGHGLGVAPSLIINKPRDQSLGWTVYHASLGNSAYLILNTTAAQVTGATTVWNATSPTSTVFSQGAAFAGIDNMVAYCFAPVDGYSSFGSYTGNGSADGPFVYTGFRPRWVMIKCSTDSTSPDDWFIYDTERDTYNSASKFLSANYSGAEQVRSDPATLTDQYVDVLANGFKIRNSRGVMNLSAETYIYAAFAENPFALNARAR